MTESRFRMPAEWEPQSATWASWPHNLETWPDNLTDAQNEFVEFVTLIASKQPVNIMAPASQHDLCRSCFSDQPNVHLLNIETNDAWARDYAPTFVRDANTNQIASIDWHYNAWGGKYPPYDADQKVANQVAKHLGIENISGQLCFEGGGLEVNSQGVLLTTESCLLHANRNSDLTRAAAEKILQQNLGCTQIVWLPGDVGSEEALPGDDTDGHIDQLARFTSDNTIVHAWVETEDRRHAALKANLAALSQQLPDTSLIPLRLPPEFEFRDRQIPASYCNFLITNDHLIVPQFGFEEDELALQTLAPLFPNRKIMGLSSRHLSVGLGSFHCLSQQQPAT